jgi:hypothetical protein
LAWAGRQRREFLPTAAEQSSIRTTKGQRILARLRQGPATTLELAQITVAFSQRLGDMKRDLSIEVSREDFCEGGQEWSKYTLVKDVEISLD